MIKNLYGLLLCFIVAFTCIFLSNFIGSNILGFEKSPISSIMLSILLGILIANIINLDDSFSSGIHFSLTYILRLGIICLGIRIGLSDMFYIGISSIPLIISCIGLTIIFVNVLSKYLGINKNLATLIAVGTSICGATAIVATSPVINAKKEETTYAIANITIFGLIAMLAYPFIAHFVFSGNDRSIGLFLGTSIHETAQVAGAGLIYAQQFYSPETLDTATITKLIRNLSMVIVIPLMSYLYLRSKDQKNVKNYSIYSIFPLFILGFLFLGIIRTVGDYNILNEQKALFLFDNEIWILVISIIKITSEISLGVAMSAVGLSTKFSTLSSLGLKPFYAGLIAAFSVGLVSIVGIKIIEVYHF